MPDLNPSDPTTRTLSQLGVYTPVELALKFTDLRAQLQRDLTDATQSGNWDDLGKKWGDSTDSVVSRIRTNWSSAAPEQLKQLVSRHLEDLTTEVFLLSTVMKTLDQLRVTRPEQIAKQFAVLRDFFDRDVAKVADEISLGMIRTTWLGRSSGVLTHVTNRWLKTAPPNLKRETGSEFNKLKSYIEGKLASWHVTLEQQAEARAALKDRVDLSLPGVIRPIGTHHLIRTVIQEIEDIFLSIGFSIVEGPEIETPYYNFEALNIPEHHPVRDDMDTFYLDVPKGAPGPLLLRTHTSPVQIHTMEKRQPPVRVIVPGKVYRRDNPDATHSFMFHQIEGLAVDTDITFCDFTGTIEYFVRQFFGETVKTRFRPSYFPFTEPSVEFDVSCIFCGGSGTAACGGTCGKCKGAGWIELFGAGMVDPAVYGFVNYDASKVSGFAFGMGMDRLAMLKYGIDDLQVFFQSDVRFLRQFP